MISFKKGFSLAELLIAMSIIAVIATMGFTISKQGVENAYNLYWYTGYKGIQDAISGASDEGHKAIPDNLYCRLFRYPKSTGEHESATLCPGESHTFNEWASGNYWSENGGPCATVNTNFIDYIVKILNSKQESTRMNGNSIAKTRIVAPNGITYTVMLDPDDDSKNSSCTYPYVNFSKDVFWNSDGSRGVTITNNGPRYPYAMYIEMTTPHVKGKIGKANLLYLPSVNNGMLVPLSNSFDPNAIDLQNRKDLLPFYIDDGIAGRVIIPNGAQQPNQFQSRKFYSYREAYCKQNNNQNLDIISKFGDLFPDGGYAPLPTENSTTVISCDGIEPPDPNENTNGFIRVENPKKIF